MEENDKHQVQRQRLRNQGQTLAEFAITLPILLLLIFGIIEFGRLFQAWVTLQNSVREATRYATTGIYDEEKYDIDTIVPCDELDLRGNLVPFTPNPIDPTYVVQIYEGGEESLYATWYDGEDCDPTNTDHQQRRKDLLRIVSIMDEARRGAAGISLEASRLPGSGATRDNVQDVLYSVWQRPLPRSDRATWFNVMICSSRFNYNAASTSFDPNIATFPFVRFLTVLEEEDGAAPPESLERYAAPFCLLNEVQPSGIPGATYNAGVRWLDAGAPGDRVNVVVTFNHPLITPIGIAEYVQMEARRSGVNEAFRASRALAAVAGSAPGAGDIATPTPLPPTATPLPTDTYTPTATTSPTSTNPPTETPGPFSCDNITVSNVSFFAERFFMEIENRNYDDSELTRVVLHWSTSPVYPNMYLATTALESDVNWSGNHPNSPHDTDGFTGNEQDDWDDADKRVLGNGRVSIFEGVMLNAGGNLGAILDRWDFGGTEMYFYNPDTGGSCVKTLELPPEPSPTPNTPPPVGSTATFTPNCASTSIGVEWGGFDTFGVVRLRIVNNRYDVAPLLDFSVNWPDPSSLNPPLSPGIFRLDRITVGGSNPDDPSSVTVWSGPDSSNTPPTVPSEGTWLTTYTFPPRSVTNLFLDFTGTGSDLQSAFGILSYMFNGTWFDIGCGQTAPGGGGPGGGASGPIFLSTIVPPPPTNTPQNTNTPGPTRTPTPTRPTSTPSRTFTPGPTRTPTNTPTITRTPSPTPFVPPTPKPSGGGE